MHAIADTEKLVEDGVISAEQAQIIEERAKVAMTELAINSVLCFGILVATLGLIFWLGSALSVAIVGLLTLAAGALTLKKASDTYRMFGNAATLIGIGMLLGGSAFELIDKYEEISGWILFPLGFLTMISAIFLSRSKYDIPNMVTGSVILLGLAIHLLGLAILATQFDVAGLPKALIYLYAAIAITGIGWRVDVRLITALGIVPFAQALDTSTSYFHAAYVFYSPEPSLSIIQMTLLIILGVWIAQNTDERHARHARISVMIAFVVANLCALVGSLWGDVVGETVWGPTRGDDWRAYQDAKEVFRETALVIPDYIFVILWAVALIAMIFWAARNNNRGLFNASLTFAAIHAYTQWFETFGDHAFAYVIGGLAAIPVAWAIWRLSQNFSEAEPED